MSSRLPRLTSVQNFKNAPLIGLAEGNGSFSNYVLATLVLGVPWLLKRVLPLINRGGFKTYLFLTALLGVPVTIAYWTLMSMFGQRKNDKVTLPGKDIEEYITIKDPELKARYHDKEKIPMQTFHDAYFDGKIDFNGMSLSLQFDGSLTCLCRRHPRHVRGSSRLGKDGLHPRTVQIRSNSDDPGTHRPLSESGRGTGPRPLRQYASLSAQYSYHHTHQYAAGGDDFYGWSALSLDP